MADELLSIIRLENQIQEHLQLEQERADAWLERVRTEEKAKVLSIDQMQKEVDVETLQQSRKRAEEEAAALEGQEAERCRRLAALDDNELVEVLKRHLMRVLPGRVDDYQDVQS